MSQFLVSHGPDPQIQCVACGGVARMAQYFPGTPRPADFGAVKRLHACGPGPWDLNSDAEPDQAAIGAVP